MFQKSKQIATFAATMIGAMVGAGFASGQEMIHFFARFYPYTIYLLMITTILMIVGIHRLLRIGSESTEMDWNGIFRRRLSPRLFHLASKWTTFTFFVMCAAMLSAANELCATSWHLPKPFGAFILCVFTYFVLQRGLVGVVRWSSLITFTLFLFFIASAYYAIDWSSTDLIAMNRNPSAISLNVEMIHQPFWIGLYPLWFVAYNLSLAQGMLYSLAAHTKKANTSYIVATVTSLGLVFLLTIGCLILLQYPHVWHEPLPLVSILQTIHPIFALGFPLILFLEMFSTFLAGIYSLNTKKTVGSNPAPNRSFYLLIMTFILAWIPFQSWVQSGYPLLGIGCTAIFLLVILKPIQKPA
jgi:uncharacterized membrane protein YkvI